MSEIQQPIALTRELILASNSPRRKQLLQEAGFRFETLVREVDEDYPDTMHAAEVPLYLARKKMAAFENELAGKLVLCADTVVISGGSILNKPAGAAAAREMLRQLSGNTHEVITGICLGGPGGIQMASDRAMVTFRELRDWEIDYYIGNYRPYDKAGAYGIQEWIGMVAVERIEGSYYTIMGLPVHKVYELLEVYMERYDGKRITTGAGGHNQGPSAYE